MRKNKTTFPAQNFLKTGVKIIIKFFYYAWLGWVKSRLNASDIKSGVPQKKDFVARCVEEPFKKLKNIRGM